MVLIEQDFGTFRGETVKKFTWNNKSGFSVSVISYGAIIQSIKVPDRFGSTTDVLLGFDDLEGYVERNTPYFSATVGRCANRIGGAKFEIDGVTYELARNDGKNSLHGGIVGFDKVHWKSVIDENKVIFSYLSKDGEEGYPGDLVTSVIYEVTNDDTLSVEYIATTTKKTVVNLTNHSYFNLAGHSEGKEQIYKHVVTINADKITETTSDSIPTGKLLNVGDTPYDLRTAMCIGDLLAQTSYDDNYCVSTYSNGVMTFVSRVDHPPSGRYLEVHSDQPGVQFYTANSLPGSDDEPIEGKGGASYRSHGAFCLETQKYPDAIHHPNFVSPILKPGDIYRHRVSYTFGVNHHRR